jgi:hypothetical protein
MADLKDNTRLKTSGNQADNLILESIKTAVKRGYVELPDPRLYGNDWRIVTIRLHNIYDIPQWRAWVTDLATTDHNANTDAANPPKSVLGEGA